MKSSASFLVVLLYISLCVCFKLNETGSDNESNNGENFTPPDTRIEDIKSKILRGPDPYANITTKPSFIHGNESNSCYPAEYFVKTPNWWGNGPTPIPQNTIFRKDDRGCNNWATCTLTAGRIGILYFRTGSDAASYDTTYYNTGLEYTLSPTVYLVLETAWGWATDSNLPSGALQPTRVPANNPAPSRTSMPTLMLDHEAAYINGLSSLRKDLLATNSPQDTSSQGNNPDKDTLVGGDEPATPKATLTAPENGPRTNLSTATSVAPGLGLGTILQSNILPTPNKRGAGDLNEDIGSVWAMPVGGVGQLGPTIANHIFAFQLSELRTLHPYSDAQEKRDRVASQLQLSDLYSDCPITADFNSLSKQTHPLIGDRDYRCFPRFSIPSQIFQWGRPWWNNCRVLDMEKGLFDPPIALATRTGNLVPTTPAEPAARTSADPSKRPHLPDGWPPRTYLPWSSPTSTNSGNITPPKSSETPGPVNPIESSSISLSSDVGDPGISPEYVVPDQPLVQVSSNSHNEPTSEIPTPNQKIGGGIVSVSPIINSEDESLAPVSIISGESTRQSGCGAFNIPANDGSGKCVYVSLTTNVVNQKDAWDGNQQEGRTVMLSTLQAAAVKSQYIGEQFVEIATRSSGKYALSADKSTATYMGATLVQGEIRTTSNAVLSYGPAGVVVRYSGGAVSTFYPSSPPAAKRPNTQPVSINGTVSEGMKNGSHSQNFVPSQSKVESLSATKASSSANVTTGSYSKQVTITASINTATSRNNSPDKPEASSSMKKNGCGVLAPARSLWLIMLVISFSVCLEIF